MWRDPKFDIDAVERRQEIRNALAAMPSKRRPEIADLLARLRNCRPTRRGWCAKCPAHSGDVAPWLSIRRGPDGTLTLRCPQRCKLIAVMGAVGLTRQDAKALRLRGDV